MSSASISVFRITFARSSAAPAAVAASANASGCGCVSCTSRWSVQSPPRITLGRHARQRDDRPELPLAPRELERRDVVLDPAVVGGERRGADERDAPVRVDEPAARPRGRGDEQHEQTEDDRERQTEGSHRRCSFRSAYRGSTAARDRVVPRSAGCGVSRKDSARARARCETEGDGEPDACTPSRLAISCCACAVASWAAVDLGLVRGEVTRAERGVGRGEVLGRLVEQDLDLLLDRTLRRLASAALRGARPRRANRSTPRAATTRSRSRNRSPPPRV